MLLLFLFAPLAALQNWVAWGDELSEADKSAVSLEETRLVKSFVSWASLPTLTSVRALVGATTLLARLTFAQVSSRITGQAFAHAGSHAGPSQEFHAA